MNDHSHMDSGHANRLGGTHPHIDLTNGHTDLVHGKDCDGWMKEWLQWFLELSYDESPFVPKQINPFNKPYNNTIFPTDNKEEGVMFLAVPGYGSSGNTYSSSFETVPLGLWHIFFSPYVIFNSQSEYPSLTEEELFDLAQRQVNSIYNLEVKLDGLSVECCRVTLDTKKNIEVEKVPDKNILGISQAELNKVGHKIKVAVDGYACFLKPLKPGLHTLSYRAYSPTYSVDTQVQLNVRGPSKK